MKNIRTVAAAAALITALSWAGGLAPSASAQVTADNGLTVKAEKKTGWVTKDGKKYLYGKDGKKVTGLKKVNGKLYCFDSTGAVRTGFLKVNGKTYYFTAEGAIAGKTVKIEGRTYTFDENGVLQQGQQGQQKKQSTAALQFGMSEKEAEAILRTQYDRVWEDDDTLYAASSKDTGEYMMYAFVDDRMLAYGQVSAADRYEEFGKAFEKAGYSRMQAPTAEKYGISIYTCGGQIAFVLGGRSAAELADTEGTVYAVFSAEGAEFMGIDEQNAEEFIVGSVT